MVVRVQVGAPSRGFPPEFVRERGDGGGSRHRRWPLQGDSIGCGSSATRRRRAEVTPFSRIVAKIIKGYCSDGVLKMTSWFGNIWKSVAAFTALHLGIFVRRCNFD